jgi:serine/threonine protein kinase
MSAPDELLIRTADSIAAGDNVDWHGLHKQVPDPQQSRILSEMQILERIATFLRSSDSEKLSDKATTQRPKPAMPESWAHFKLIELIGEGGFGSVYRARDTKLQTEVALKLVDLPGGRELRPAGALKEARLLARVRHSNVVTVHGADIVDGRVGIWMQLIEGQTLATLLRGNGPFGAHEAALIGVDLCRALAAVHAAGLIHGDVKTRNVMREAGGRIVLMDFGTGRDLSALRLHGARDDAAGTPLYLAPEVFDGQPQSRVTDTYGLGVLLYHLVTNEYPVKGQTQAEVEEAHRRNERTNLRDARPDLPQSFVALVERALSRDPGDRFQTAGAFEAALAEFLGQPKPLPLPNLRKGWLNVAALASVVLVIIVATVLMERRWTQRLPSAVASPAAAGPAVAAAAPASYRIETSFYRRGADGATRLRAGDRIAPGDALFMKLQVSTPTYVYIVNEDDHGGSLLLFPLPGQAVANPIAAETMVRVPGTRNEEISWQVSNLGGREHFLIFASPERVTAFEDLFATLPRPVFGKPVSRAEPIPTGTMLKLRSVGGLTTAPTVKTSANLANVFKTPLGDGPETANGLWVRQLTLDNPPGKR